MGGGTNGKGVEGGEGAAASKLASREGFSKQKVTCLLSNKKSLLNDPFEAFVWVSFVRWDSHFLALMEAEECGSDADTWVKIKAKMDLDYSETDRVAKVYTSSAKGGRPRAQMWDQSAVTFSNWLADHEQAKVCDICEMQ